MEVDMNKKTSMHIYAHSGDTEACIHREDSVGRYYNVTRSSAMRLTAALENGLRNEALHLCHYSYISDNGYIKLGYLVKRG